MRKYSHGFIIWLFFVVASFGVSIGLLWYAYAVDLEIRDIGSFIERRNGVTAGWLRQQEDKDILDLSKVPLDTSTWNTYRNNEYGFEVKYPKNWKVTDGYTAIIGLPADCGQPSNKSFCNNFSLVFSYGDGKNYTVAMQTLGLINEDVGNDISDMMETYSGIKYGDSLSLNEEFGACFRTATFPFNTLKKGIRFWFFAFYEIDETLQRHNGDVCNDRHVDPYFDEIVKSLIIYE